ncbi:MAG: anhydro-N-acetylmuramic acid kinase [Ferruginibacter sp.]
MRAHIENLNAISLKQKRRIIGLMSGTSLDGLDIALCGVEGSGLKTKLIVEEFITLPYDDHFKDEVRQVFSKKTIDLEKLCLLNKWVANRHAYMINETLQNWQINPESVDLVASHGQTIYHAPQHLHSNTQTGHATLQIGDGDQIATITGIITISDFRQKHIAAGGEGAPLAAYGDYLLFADVNRDTVLLNIGGIANFTLLPSGSSGQKMFSTDCGPGNTMMDAWMQKNYPGKSFDEDAAVAKKGRVNKDLLQVLKDDSFFGLPFPKSTGPELFGLEYLQKAMLQSQTTGLPAEDVMLTLNIFTASTITESLQKIKSKKLKVFTSGGGMHNPLVVAYLQEKNPDIIFNSTIEKNIDPDAKEAILFAILANECVAGNASTFANYFPNTSMGKISFPG